jgi:hypothetical protein
VEQLLWLETLLKGGIGVVLALTPVTLAKALGLPRPSTTFWPRLVGALLFSLGVAAFLTGAGHVETGLGLGALAVINLVGAAALMAALMTSNAGETRRGRLLIAAMTAFLIVLSSAEMLAA